MGELGPLSPLWSLGRTWKLVFPVPCALLPLGLGVPMRTLLPVPSPALEGAGQSFLSPVSTVAEPDGWNTACFIIKINISFVTIQLIYRNNQKGGFIQGIFIQFIIKALILQKEGSEEVDKG